MGSTTCLVSNIFSIVSIKVKLFSFLDHNINQDTYDDDGGPGGHGGPGGPGGHGGPGGPGGHGGPGGSGGHGDPVDWEDTGTRWIGTTYLALVHDHDVRRLLLEGLVWSVSVSERGRVTVALCRELSRGGRPHPGRAHETFVEGRLWKEGVVTTSFVFQIFVDIYVFHTKTIS